MIKYLLFCWYVILFLSCCEEERPGYATRELIFPDYRNVTIPVDIAPLSFYVNLPEVNENVQVLLCTRTKQLNRRGKEVRFSSLEWRELVTSDSVMNVYIQKKTDHLWNCVDSFKIYISSDPIDPYLSYRLIEPGYEVWGNMGIYQRCLANYEEDAIFENSRVKEICVN